MSHRYHTMKGGMLRSVFDRIRGVQVNNAQIGIQPVVENFGIDPALLHDDGVHLTRNQLRQEFIDEFNIIKNLYTPELTFLEIDGNHGEQSRERIILLDSLLVQLNNFKILFNIEDMERLRTFFNSVFNELLDEYHRDLDRAINLITDDRNDIATHFERQRLRSEARLRRREAQPLIIIGQPEGRIAYPPEVEEAKEFEDNQMPEQEDAEIFF